LRRAARKKGEEGALLLYRHLHAEKGKGREANGSWKEEPDERGGRRDGISAAVERG